MKTLTNYEQFVAKKLKRPSFKKAFAEESLRLQVAYQILELRRKHALTQHALARRIGTTQSVIARIEQGRENISVDRLDSIAHLFGKQIEVQFIAI
ncbi:MAG: helix-turn-helix transcriptional regulator [bacterium]|nr:helix-turn-helix transcriptional regulator [bacterium]